MSAKQCTGMKSRKQVVRINAANSRNRAQLQIQELNRTSTLSGNHQWRCLNRRMACKHRRDLAGPFATAPTHHHGTPAEPTSDVSRSTANHNSIQPRSSSFLDSEISQKAWSARRICYHTARRARLVASNRAKCLLIKLIALLFNQSLTWSASM